MSTSDTISLTPAEIESIVNAINSLTNSVAGTINSIRLELTPKTIDATANSTAQSIVIIAALVPALISGICTIAADAGL